MRSREIRVGRLPAHRKKWGRLPRDRWMAAAPVPGLVRVVWKFTMSKEPLFERPKLPMKNPTLQILFDPFLF